MEKTKVAFICTHNSCRSQIAEAFGRTLFPEEIEWYSAGTHIADHINADAVRLMKEHYGIDMTQQYPKKLEELPRIDIVITMGCGVQCPMLPCKERYDWGLEDPTGKEDSEFLKIMDMIHEKVIQLAKKKTDTSRYSE